MRLYADAPKDTADIPLHWLEEMFQETRNNHPDYRKLREAQKSTSPKTYLADGESGRGDGDLLEDTDNELEGWDIRIYEDAGTIGTLDAADVLLATDTTDANGEYEFPDLGPGSYIVCEVLQAGWDQTAPASGADCTFDPTNAPIGYAFTAQSGVDHLDNDFGNTELFRLIIITCSEANDTLVVSEVTPAFTGSPLDTIGTPPALSGKTTAELQAYLCNLGGAQYNNLPRGTYETDTEIPKVP